MDDSKNTRNDEVQKGLSRRGFLRGSLIAGAAGAGAAVIGLPHVASAQSQQPVGGCTYPWSWEAPVEPIPAGEITQTADADVVILGAGLAGICAAIAAAEEGASVVVVDKNPTWAARGGHITAFDSRLQKELGIENDYRQIIRDWVAWAQGRIKEDLLWLFGRKSGACMDWVMDLVEPKGLQVSMWESYYKGPDYTEYPVTHFFYTEGSNLSYQNGQIEGAGNTVLVAALEEVAREKGVQFAYEQPAVRILRDGDGPVTGVITGATGAYTQYNAAKGVIIATGDYASNREMVTRYSPFTLNADAQIYFPNKCNTGDGHVMAMQVGGAMQKYEPHAAVIHLEAGAASYGFLHVNGLGQRFMNEDVNTQSKSCVKEYQPDGICWTVYDSKWLEEVASQVDNGVSGGLFFGQTFQPWGQPFSVEMERDNLENHIRDGRVVTSDTLEGLAQRMQVPVENLVTTVNRYNEMVDAKNDTDFGKRKELLTSVSEGPFYAGRLMSTTLTTCGGLRTNTDLSVLDANDQPIQNLYVAGAAQGDFFANDYPTICPGIGHGRCITFGRLTGIKAAGGSLDEVPSLDI